MKVLFVSCACLPYHRGGVAVLLDNLIAEFTQRGHQVFAFSLFDDPLAPKYSLRDLQRHGAHLRFINLPGSSLTNFFGRYQRLDYENPAIVPYFQEYLKKIQPDLVHFHSIQGLGASLVREAKRAGYPTVLTMHDWWWFCPNFFLIHLNHQPCGQKRIDLHKCARCLEPLRSFPQMQDREFSPSAFLEERQGYLTAILQEDVDLVLAVSRYLKSYLPLNGIPEEKIRLNENGVRRPPLDLRLKPLNPRRIIFGFLGGLSEIKGYSVLLQAFHGLTERWSNWELHIYGVEQETPKGLIQKAVQNVRSRTLFQSLKGFVQERVNMLRQRKRIKHFPPFMEAEKYKRLNTMDVLIVPSVMRESFSLPTREAMILGKPVICSDCGSPEEVVQDGVTGFVFPSNNPEALREKVVTLLGKPQLIRELSLNARRVRVRTIQQQASELETIYKELLRFHSSKPKLVQLPNHAEALDSTNTRLSQHD